MPTTLVKLNLTHFDANAERGGYFAIGGQDGLGKRIDTLQVAEEEFLRAAKNALKPLLKEVLREADGAIAKYVTQIELVAGEVQKNRKEMEKVLRDLFKAKIEAATEQPVENPTAITATV